MLWKSEKKYVLSFQLLAPTVSHRREVSLLLVILQNDGETRLEKSLGSLSKYRSLNVEANLGAARNSAVDVERLRER